MGVKIMCPCCGVETQYQDDAPCQECRLRVFTPDEVVATVKRAVAAENEGCALLVDEGAKAIKNSGGYTIVRPEGMEFLVCRIRNRVGGG